MARVWCTDRVGIHSASAPVAISAGLGSSEPPFASFNLGLKVGDDPVNVLGNRERLVQATGLDEIRFMDQIHSALMVEIDADVGEEKCDGIFLIKDGWNEKVGLAVQVADCVPLIITGASVIAAIHIGRDGLIDGMTEAALDTLERFTKLDELEALIGPSICGNCYPNSEEVFNRCTNRYPATSFDARERKLDVAAGVISLLESRGLHWGWFSGKRECVSCDDRYFSYRRASNQGNGATGRQAMVVGW